MTSRKYEKAASEQSFWKKSSIAAVPGRPNLSSSKLTSAASASGPAMPTSFRAFDASVSDAWNVQEDPLPAPAVLHRTNGAPARSNEAAAVPVSPPRPGSGEGSRRTITSSVSDPVSSSPASSKSERIEKLLTGENIDLEVLRSLSWSGMLPKVRSKAWRILCGYLPGRAFRNVRP